MKNMIKTYIAAIGLSAAMGASAFDVSLHMEASGLYLSKTMVGVVTSQPNEGTGAHWRLININNPSATSFYGGDTVIIMSAQGEYVTSGTSSIVTLTPSVDIGNDQKWTISVVEADQTTGEAAVARFTNIHGRSLRINGNNLLGETVTSTGTWTHFRLNEVAPIRNIAAEYGGFKLESYAAGWLRSGSSGGVYAESGTNDWMKWHIEPITATNQNPSVGDKVALRNLESYYLRAGTDNYSVKADSLTINSNEKWIVAFVQYSTITGNLDKIAFESPLGNHLKVSDDGVAKQENINVGSRNKFTSVPLPYFYTAIPDSTMSYIISPFGDGNGSDPMMTCKYYKGLNNRCDISINYVKANDTGGVASPHVTHYKCVDNGASSYDDGDTIKVTLKIGNEGFGNTVCGNQDVHSNHIKQSCTNYDWFNDDTIHFTIECDQ